MVLFLFLLLLAMVLGIIGAVAHGLLYLLIIAIALFIADLTYAGLRLRRGTGRHAVR
ncbi:hypothetical protein GCM10018781_72650 [Kitasatospora indigofera]|uniref:Uncharacterized protein n=1 Tax=Kitasatospora indigofera TaxID=67307 RepID=A0A919GGM6_9ACTN|nr:hypothetical protein [Kitasatospora indigofera]GHH84064.1 hypothetical protein GCM10018781_72650 [Kitasatospora indigofera]